MKSIHYLAVVGACLWLAAAPVSAQEGAAATADAPLVAVDVAPDAVAPGPPPADDQTCELHVWPTDNYLGVNMGLLSGFGPIGAVADMEAHKGKVATVKDLMREYLGPDIQLAELDRMNYRAMLKLPATYRIVIEESTPFNEDLKGNPELKAKVKAMNAKIKGGERLSGSTNPCYAELITTHIFYHKAMMYGSNLFTGWIYREFPATGKATKTATGQVKNPLENFPPKTAEMIEPAKAELRDAYSKDFAEYVEKKVFGGAK